MKKVLLGVGIVLVGWALAVFIPWKTSGPQPEVSAQKAIFNIDPSNTTADALAQLTKAMNDRDSATFWNTLTYESQPTEVAHAESQVLWDSSATKHIAIRELGAPITFRRTVHRPQDTALFAHSTIEVTLTGHDIRGLDNRTDTMTALLRVDNGRWHVGGLSLYTANKPFVGAGDHN